MTLQILLTNDDGIHAPGLAVLRAAIDGLGEITTIAPDHNASAVARGITIDRPLHLEPVTFGEGWPGLACDGTPSDCVRIGLLGVRGPAPDLVVSGVNCGANMGADVTYSGTVGAALEAALRGRPALAFSVESHEPGWLAEAAPLLRAMVEHVIARGLPRHSILNINLPDRPLAELAGIHPARLGGASCCDRVFLSGAQNFVDRLLDAEVYRLEAVVAENNVDQVLADVVNIALHGGQHNGALARLLRAFHVRFEVRDCGFHHFRALQHERKLHLSGGEQFAHGAHAGKQCVVDDLECGTIVECKVEVVGETLTFAIDDSSFESLKQRKGGEFLGTGCCRGLRLRTVEQGEEMCERVVSDKAVSVVLATIPHEFEGGVTLVIGDARHRQNFRRMNDRRIQACLNAFVQKY